ncbi:MAG: hypothetical protein Q8P90_05315 [bacterium]|nr:hypothetical protein [bacterium]
MFTKIKTVAATALFLSLPSIAAATESLAPPFAGAEDAEPILIIGAIIQALLGIVGAATLLMFIWGGFKVLFSGGNEEKIKKGRSTLLWAAIGLAIILSSYAILQYTFAVFQSAATG